MDETSFFSVAGASGVPGGNLDSEKDAGHAPSDDGDFRMVADHANDGVLILKPDGRYVYANYMASRITGYTIEEIRTMGMSELLHPDTLPQAWIKLRKRLKGEHFPSPWEGALINKNGATVHIEVTGIKTLWAGEPADLVIIRDITELKRTERQLSETETTLREVADNIPGAVFQLLLRKDGAFVFPYMSERFQRMFGYDSGAVEQNPRIMYRLVPKEDLVRNRALILESVRTLEPYRLEHRTISDDGEVRWLRVVGTPHRLKSGETLWNAVAIDVTDMKQTERALEKARDELESRVKARTEELRVRNAELQEVNSALRVLFDKRDEDREKVGSRILANIEEQVLPYIRKLSDTALDEEQRGYLDLVQAGLKDVVSPFPRRLSRADLNLTPAQIRVATMIKQGRKSLEIARLLNISPKTVQTHRKILRKNLGLQGKRVNLRTFLLSLDD